MPSPLWLAVEFDRIEAARLLLQFGSSTDEVGRIGDQKGMNMYQVKTIYISIAIVMLFYLIPFVYLCVVPYNAI
jgi:hypothetical protein